MFKLYKAYSLIPSSRLTGEHEEDDIRIEWICYFRDDPLPCAQIVENYQHLLEMDEDHDADGYGRWIQSRVNNLIREEEREDLEQYLLQKYDLPVYFEPIRIPINAKNLPWFKEKYIDSMVILNGRDDPFKLESCIVGMVSPFKNLNSINTVREFLREIDRQNGR